MMKKTSPWFKATSDTPYLIHQSTDMGSIWALYVDKKPHWMIEIDGLSYTFPVDPQSPESFLVHIVEEAAHRLGNIVSLKIEPARVKGLRVKAGTTSEEIQPFVDHLGKWYLGEEYWKDDEEWQKYIAR